MLYRINKKNIRDCPQYKSATLYKVSNAEEVSIESLPKDTIFKVVRTTTSRGTSISLLDTACSTYATTQYMEYIGEIEDGATSWVESKLLVPFILLKRA